MGGDLSQHCLPACLPACHTERRRQIEQELSDGRLCAVVATNALELGLDIGALDATVHVGFPVSQTPNAKRQVSQSD